VTHFLGQYVNYTGSRNIADIQLIQCKNQHYLKTVSDKVVAQSIYCLSSGINIMARVAPFP